MNRTYYADFIARGIPKEPSSWAEFGSGEGVFTRALIELLGIENKIYSIEADGKKLQTQVALCDREFPYANVEFLHADFLKPLVLPPLDGILAANALHFNRDRISQMEIIYGYLKKGGRLVIVEYNVDEGNNWVPFPFSFETFKQLCEKTGFEKPVLLKKVPSRFLGEMYSCFTKKI